MIVCVHWVFVHSLAFLFFRCEQLVIIAVGIAHTLARYGFQLYDLRHDGMWEARTSAAFVTEFCFDMVQLVVTLAHYLHIWFIVGCVCGPGRALYSTVHVQSRSCCRLVQTRAHARSPCRCVAVVEALLLLNLDVCIDAGGRCLCCRCSWWPAFRSKS